MKAKFLERIKELTNKAEGIRAIIAPFADALDVIESDIDDAYREVRKVGDYDVETEVIIDVLCNSWCCVDFQTKGTIIALHESGLPDWYPEGHYVYDVRDVRGVIHYRVRKTRLKLVKAKTDTK